MTFAAVMMLQAAVAWQVGPGDVTVGDTVVVEREVLVVDPAANILLGALEPSDLVEPLRAPEVLRTADGFIARYTLAVFEPGEHTIPMPDVELEYPGGRRETLLGGAAFVTVMSVLPSGDSLPLPPPRGPRIPVVRTITRTLPTVLLVTSVLVATVVWGVARRRSQPRPAWKRADGAGGGGGGGGGGARPASDHALDSSGRTPGRRDCDDAQSARPGGSVSAASGAISTYRGMAERSPNA